MKYNVLVGRIHHLSLRLSTLSPNDPFRSKHEASLLNKLYDMALLDMGTKMSDVTKKINVSCFCRRRLPVVMVRMKMAETVGQVSIQE